MRIFFLLLAIILLYFIVKHFLRKPSDSVHQQKKVNIVKCEVCSVHLPINEATEKDGLWYCSEHNS